MVSGVVGTLVMSLEVPADGARVVADEVASGVVVDPVGAAVMSDVLVEVAPDGATLVALGVVVVLGAAVVVVEVLALVVLVEVVPVGAAVVPVEVLAGVVVVPVGAGVVVGVVEVALMKEKGAVVKALKITEAATLGS